MNGQLWWYMARSGGIVAWALLAASVLWGLALSTKVTNGKPKPNWILDLHRFLGGLALIFTGIHVGSLILDTYVHFGLVEVLVPFTGTWHPAAVAWGVIGLYLLLAVELTSLARKQIPKQIWRKTHYLSFPLFFFTTVHALSAGTDRKTFMLLLTIAVATAMVTILTFVRLRKAERRAERSTVAARRDATGAGEGEADVVATRSAQHRSRV